MFTILHITDLHRSSREPISNAELISALISDRAQFGHETPSIAAPQAIVVSGDIIQGVPLYTPDFESRLVEQYEVAHDFLVDLTERFLGGDRSKVIIVPGNHDIDWNTAFASMEEVPLSSIPSDLPAALYAPDSLYRWDWQSRRLYLVTDSNKYKQRFEPYQRFFHSFYDGTPGLLRVDPKSNANLYSLDGGRIGVAAFNSCASNDCFAFHGEILRDTVAQAHIDLCDLGPWRLRVAVWHHDIEGPPSRVDYMDPDIVRGMIGRGFRLGLYGHQHRPQITPQHAYLPERETMAVVSAGSLCAGRRELPLGARRGYSVIEIGENYDEARVHVREMAFANLFSRANLAVFAGRSYVDLQWTTPVDAGGRPEDPEHLRRASTLRLAEDLLRSKGDPNKALELLDTVDTASDSFGRRLLIDAIRALNDPTVAIAKIAVPTVIDEIVMLVDAHLQRDDFRAAENILRDYAASLGLPAATRADLDARIDLVRRTKL